MDRKDPVGVCFSARNACSEKKPQIRHHRPCVESGKAMRSDSSKVYDHDVLMFISFSLPHSQPRLSSISPAALSSHSNLSLKPNHIGLCPEVSLVLAQFQTS